MADTRDVLFVVIDSARKDRVSAYDHDRETTPVLESLADESTVYENAVVPAPWTLPAHCSMFTGRYPSEHGITNGFTDRNLALDPAYDTVAELLAERGFATAGFSNNPWVGQLSGLNRGFDRFVEWDLEVSREGDPDTIRTRDRVYSKLHAALGRAANQPQVLLKRRFFTSNLVDRAAAWLDEMADRPSFTFVNVMEAHSPYYPPRSAFRKLGLDTPGPIEPRVLNARLLAYVLGKADLAPEHRERVLEYYDASLRFQDGQLGRLVDRLKEAGRYDDALVVVCADHGKTLGEYPRDATPTHYIRDHNVNVPLLVKWPNRTAGERVESPVELTDLFGVVRDAGEVRSLPERDDGGLVEDFVPHTGRNASGVVRWRCLLDPERKYARNDDGEEYLFERWPDETPVDAPDEALAPYRERLDERVDALSSPTGTTSDAAASQDLGSAVEGQLEDLGYLS